MISYTINIAVDPPGVIPEGGSCGNFVYTPALLRVQPQDEVTWTCEHPFTVVFKEKTPIETLVVSGCPAETGFSAGPFTIRDVHAQYHYAVAVSNRHGIFMDASCPHISVN